MKHEITFNTNNNKHENWNTKNEKQQMQHEHETWNTKVSMEGGKWEMKHENNKKVKNKNANRNMKHETL